MRRLAFPIASCLCLASSIGLASAAPKEKAKARHGDAGIGDPYFPLDGNGGYDVQHYDLNLSYEPDTDVLTGVATITAIATQGLSRFNLDFDGLTVRSITVNGTAVKFHRKRWRARNRPQDGHRQRRDIHDRRHLRRHPGPDPRMAKGAAGSPPTTA